MNWIVYILRLRDDSLYCGITTDYENRMRAHRAKKGSKYVASRLPIKSGHVLMEFEGRDNPDAKGDALRLEAHIKALTRAQKLEWIASDGPARKYMVMLSADE